ncbi:MAG TPA: ATP synthase F1 subunit gamma [Dehalococcoidales bacterium]|nr:ATP synthase F1 subunit gamma [Dehalococcoidales bacterium]
MRQRIKGVQNTAKITRAMELIASSKMRKAQERGLAGRPYSDKIKQVIADLAAMYRANEETHPLLRQRPVKNITIVHITPDRGLVGGLDANLNRKTGAFILQQKADVSLLVIGRRGIDYMRRYQRKISAEFTRLGDKPSLIDTLPISRIIMDEYTRCETDMVYIAYAQYINVMRQVPAIEQILPVIPEESVIKHNYDYIFEPDANSVLDKLLPRFVESEVYHTILESIASEQSSRMVAMKNATQSANELQEELTLAYYKARQESITSELLDIVGGASAIS